MAASDERDLQDDLNATAESLRDDAKRVVDIEDRKQDLEAGDPRVDTLSREAERLAGQIQDKSRVQREISNRDEQANGSDAGERAN